MIDTLAPGAAGSVIAGPVDADGYAWYQIDVAGQTGWAARDFLAYGTLADVAAVGGATTATAGSLLVNTDSLNVRAAAGLDSAVLEMVVSGDSVTSTGASVSADGYDWSEIQTAAGTIGWVVSTYLTADSSDLLISTGSGRHRCHGLAQSARHARSRRQFAGHAGDGRHRHHRQRLGSGGRLSLVSGGNGIRQWLGRRRIPDRLRQPPPLR